MDLVIDIGNTRMTFGLYKDGVMSVASNMLYPRYLTQERIEQVLSAVFPDVNVKKCIISSVVPDITPITHAAVFNKFNVNSLILTSDFDLGIKIQSKNPKNIGTDRLANACAAAKFYKQRPIIVVDSGSATTFDILNEDDVFIGGVIMPGLMMQLKTLKCATYLLPEVNLDMMDKVQTVINNDTQKAILSGVVNGHAQAIQGLIVKCERELKHKVFVIGTGGDAQLLDKYMKYKKFDIVNLYLTLDGIHSILERNYP